MTSEEYIKKINEQIQNLFNVSVTKNIDAINNGIDFSKSLQTWINEIPTDGYKVLLSNSIQSLEISIISQTYFLHRSAFSSLRLAMEMLFGGIYFSTAPIDFIAWTKSSKDLNWHSINNFDTGVLSHRFCNAFFPELNDSNGKYFTRANDLYRRLSEHVHGNHDTWITKHGMLKVDEGEIKIFNEALREFFEIAIFALCLRFLKSLKKTQLEQVEPIILQTLNHVTPVFQHLTTLK